MKYRSVNVITPVRLITPDSSRSLSKPWKNSPQTKAMRHDSITFPPMSRGCLKRFVRQRRPTAMNCVHDDGRYLVSVGIFQRMLLCFFMSLSWRVFADRLAIAAARSSDCPVASSLFANLAEIEDTSSGESSETTSRMNSAGLMPGGHTCSASERNGRMLFRGPK